MRTFRGRLFCCIALASIASLAIAENPDHPVRTVAPASGQVLSTHQAKIDAFNAHFRETHNGASPEQFGIQCCQITQIPVSAFTNFSNGEVWDAGSFLSGYKSPVTFGSQVYSLWAPVQLPSGVAIAFLDLYYYDNDAANDIGVELWAYPGAFDPLPSPFLVASSYSSGSPGFSYSSTLLSYTVDNDVLLSGSQLNAVIYVVGSAPNFNLGFKSVDLWWYRQVSPAPGTQTFNDVAPGDFGYQFIEALAASGITGGCGGGNYCPNNNLTRAQMAIFLSKAFGLYWRY